MQNHLYVLKYLVDEKEWRARTRRNLIFQLWEKYQPSNPSGNMVNVLDFGCGTGVLQIEFEEKFRVKTYGIDVSKSAINYCLKRGLKRVKVYDGKKIPFKSNSFDLVTAIDVLEHIENDLSILDEIQRVLKKGGLAILIVPMHLRLWSSRDIQLHHLRRYQSGELKSKCIIKGFRVLADKNIDLALFFLLSILCLVVPKKKGVPDIKTQAVSINRIVNEIMYSYGKLENKLQDFLNFPFGVSNAVVVQKV